MNSSRINFKVFMDQGAEVPTETWFEVFNTWIPAPENDVLVDVADYRHVKNGPHTILVGHFANYALDTTEGRFGFLYARKRGLNGSLSGNLEEVITSGLRACKRLDEDDTLSGKVRFNGESIQIALTDRTDVDNNDQSFEALKGELTPILDRLYPGADYEISGTEDSRKALTANIKVSGSFSPTQLLENLGS